MSATTVSLPGSGQGQKNFSWTPIEQDDSISVFTIAGQKGVGKTTLAMSAEGTYLAFDFDGKTRRVWKQIFNMDPRFTIFDGKSQIPKDLNEADLPSAGLRQHDELKWLLEEARKRGPFDYVLWDGFEHMEKISELRMRAEAKIGAFDNFSNRSLWKKRKLFIQQLHELSRTVAKKGIIYVTFTKIEEITDEMGQSSISREVPRWIDIVMEETDTLMVPFTTLDQKEKIMHRYIMIPTDKLFRWGSGRCYQADNIDDATAFWKGEAKPTKNSEPMDLHAERLKREKEKAEAIKKTFEPKPSKPF